MTRGKPATNADWNACPPGALRKLSDQILATKRNQKQGQAVRRGGAALAMVLVAAVGLWGMVSWDAASTSPSRYRDVHHGGISCGKVRASFALYASGRLPVSVEEQIVEHLRMCPTCAAKFRKMRAAPTEDANLQFSLERVAQRRRPPSLERHLLERHLLKQRSSDLALPKTNLMLAALQQ